MKRLTGLLFASAIGAGFAALVYRTRLKQHQARAAFRLRELEAENAALQQALAAAKPAPPPEAPQEQAHAVTSPAWLEKPEDEDEEARWKRIKRRSAWRSIPEWLELDEDMRMSLILDTAATGMTDMFPDAEMIAEYKRLEAEGKLNPDDFKSLLDDNPNIKSIEDFKRGYDD